MATAVEERIEAFLANPAIAVVGASDAPEKYGTRVLTALLKHGYTAYPVNPHYEKLQGVRCYPTLADIPERVDAASIITPPAVTERIVEEAAAAGLTRVWMQPGAESEKAIARAEELGLSVIAGGPCILVALSLR